MHFTLGLALALSSALNVTGGSLPTAPILMPQAQTVQEYVQDYFADEPAMIAIASCESRFRQYDKDGSVLRGEQVHEDVGVMQINQTYHQAIADKLGLDLTTMQGNVAYARYLYEKSGTTPWNSSKPCWGKKLAAENAQTLAVNTK